MKKMNLAILGTGNIAAQMADTVSRMNNVVLYACASRTQEKSEDFANRFGVLNAYGSYASMLEDDNIDLVYVATPHSLHYEHRVLLPGVHLLECKYDLTGLVPLVSGEKQK